MAVALVVGAIIAMIIVLTVIPKLVGRTVDKGDRRLRATTWKNSQLEANTALSLRCPASAIEALDAIVNSVNPHVKAPAVADGTYLKSRTQSTVTFAYGNKLYPERFVAVVKMTDSNEGGGSEGAFAVARWSASGADLVGKKALQRIRERIDHAMQDLGGKVDELVDPPKLL